MTCQFCSHFIGQSKRHGHYESPRWISNIILLLGGLLIGGTVSQFTMRHWSLSQRVYGQRLGWLKPSRDIFGHNQPFLFTPGVLFKYPFLQFSSVQSLSRVWLFVTPWIAACQASLSIINSQSSLRLTSIESVMPSSHLILCRPLLLPPIPLSITVFSKESTLCMRWPKYWSFSFSISPSNEHPGLISFRMDWSDPFLPHEVKTIENLDLDWLLILARTRALGCC